MFIVTFFWKHAVNWLTCVLQVLLIMTSDSLSIKEHKSKEDQGGMDGSLEVVGRKVEHATEEVNGHTEEERWLRRTAIQPSQAAAIAFFIISGPRNSNLGLFRDATCDRRHPLRQNGGWKLWRLPGTNTDLLQLAILFRNHDALRFFLSLKYQNHRSYLGTVLFCHVHVFRQSNAYFGTF